MLYAEIENTVMRTSTSSARLRPMVVANVRGVIFSVLRATGTTSFVPGYVAKNPRTPTTDIAAAAAANPTRSLPNACTIGMNATPVMSRAVTEPACRNDAS